jgi:large subunit ribosomal protein L17
MALLRNLCTSLLEHERITTTVEKAKELRPVAEKLITLGKRGSLHARRQAAGVLLKAAVVKKLFDTLAARYADRNGGYTRIIKLAYRPGDGADTAIIELLGSELAVKKAEKAAVEKAKKEKPKKPADDTAEGKSSAGEVGKEGREKVTDKISRKIRGALKKKEEKGEKKSAQKGAKKPRAPKVKEPSKDQESSD